MRLAELVSPVFVFVTTLRRKIEQHVPLAYGPVRGEILETLATVESRAREEAMTDRWHRAKIAVTYLVDEVAIMERWSGSSEWEANPLEVEYLKHNVAMHGDWFYDQECNHAKENLDVELMEVLYLCLRLGFEGKFRGQTVQLQRHIDDLFACLPARYPDSDKDKEKLFPDCYYIDRTSNVPKGPVRLWSALAVIIGLLLTYVVIVSFEYRELVKVVKDTVIPLELESGTPDTASGN